MHCLIVDFETYSAVDLPAQGTFNYAQSLSTGILCCAFKNTESGRLWLYKTSARALHDHVYDIPNPEVTQFTPPAWLAKDLADQELLIAAHNAEFDLNIWEFVGTEVGFPAVNVERWYCTAAMARVNALPASLDRAAFAIGARQRKDHKGAALIRDCSIPDKDARETGTVRYDHSMEKLRQMGLYCAQDLEVTHYLLNNCRPMTQQEHRDWHINRAINERGVRVDMELAALAVRYAAEESEEIADTLSHMTNGLVTRHTQAQRIAKWVEAGLVEAGMGTEPMYTKKGKRSLAKGVRAELLDNVDLPEEVRDVIQLTDDGNHSSVAKFRRMLDFASDDARVRGTFVYAGASQTLRYSARNLQLHNFTRDCWDPEQTQALRTDMYAELPLDTASGETVMKTLSKLLRPALTPANGHVFVVADWSSIEARALPWLADSIGGERRLELFRDDVDVYQKTSDDLRLDDRQVGKTCELAFGYGGAEGAFNVMSRAFGVNKPQGTGTTLAKKWRVANSWATALWRATVQAAQSAMKHPGAGYHAGRVWYSFNPHLLGGTLMALLPGGAVLQYPRARMKLIEGLYGPQEEITYLKAAWAAAADAKFWPRNRLWHGLLVENNTQGFCAQLLRSKLARLEELDAPVVMHVHDEIALEVPRKRAAFYKELLTEVMTTEEVYAPGLPLKVKAQILERYGK